MTNAVAGVVPVAASFRPAGGPCACLDRDGRAAARSPGARMRGLRRALLIAVFVAAAAAAAGLIVLRGVRSLDEPLKVSAPLRFKVAPGTRFNRVAAELGGAGCRRAAAHLGALCPLERPRLGHQGRRVRNRSGRDRAQPPREAGERTGGAAFVHHRRWVACAGPAGGAPARPRHRRHAPTAFRAGPDEQARRPRARPGGPVLARDLSLSRRNAGAGDIAAGACRARA